MDLLAVKVNAHLVRRCNQVRMDLHLHLPIHLVIVLTDALTVVI